MENSEMKDEITRRLLKHEKHDCDNCEEKAKWYKKTFYLCDECYDHYCQYDEGGGMNEALHMWRLYVDTKQELEEAQKELEKLKQLLSGKMTA